MVRASQRTGLFDRLGAIQLPSEMLLRVAIRLESAERIVFPDGRDQEVAFEHGGISRGAPHVHGLHRLALAHDTLPSVFRVTLGDGCKLLAFQAREPQCFAAIDELA